MVLRIELALKGRLEQHMKAEIAAAEVAVTSVVRRKARTVRNAIAREIKRAAFTRRAFSGELSATVVAKVWPERGRSIETNGRIESKAIYGRRGGPVDLITVFSEGASIRSGAGRFLAIPTEHAPLARSGRRRASPEEMGARFPVRPTDDADLLAIVDPGRKDAEGRPLVLWWLVREVRLRQRIDPAAQHARLTADIDVQVAREWERQARKRGI